MNEWIGRAFRGALAAAALLVTLAGYSLAIAPRIEPVADRPPLDFAKLDAGRYAHVTPVAGSGAPAASEVFTGDDWERESPKTLQTSHGTLFFRDYRIEASGELTIVPITMVFPVEDAGGTRNLLVRAPQGGRLRFTERIDLAAGKIGKIEGGRLLGEISMTMDESAPGANDALDLRTRDIQIDRKLLSTPHEVSVRYGPHTAKGRDLAINFREDGDENEAFAHEALQHVASLELAHVERVLIDLDAPGLFDDEDAVAPAPTVAGPVAPVDEAQGKLELRCKDAFTLDLDRRAASFQEDVELIRLLPEGASDQLVCQLLQIHFGETPVVVATDPALPASAPPAKPKLVAERIVATGSPVMARVRSKGLEAQAQSMQYDVAERRLTLVDDAQARLTHEGRTLESPRIEYALADGGGLGTGDVRGPGRLHAIMAGERASAIELFWNDRALLRKQDGLHVISLLGGARMVADGSSTASADEAHFWLEQAPKDVRPAPTPAADGTIDASNVRPVKFLAMGRVTLDAPRISVRTPRLEAWFQELGAVAPAGGGGALSPFGPSNAAAADGKRYELNGDVVRLQVARRGPDWDLAELFLEGSVEFRETLPPELSRAKPLAVTSHGLHWKRPVDANETLRIWGDPERRALAIVDSESMRLEGPSIDVDRTLSVIQVPGEGRMRLRGKMGSISPLGGGGETPATNEASTVPGLGASAPQWVTIAWKEGFSAKDREATFRQDVKTTTDQQFAVSATLVATFDRPIDLMQTSFEAPKLQMLAFEGGIYSENRTVESGELRSIDRFQSDSLEVVPDTGQFVARGPAWISSVRLGSGDFGQPGAAAPPAHGPKSLQYFYVECARGFEGDYLKRKVTFIDRTVALFAPAESWETQFRPTDGARLPEKQVTLRCDQLALMQVAGPPAGPTATYFLEALASGNARLESKNLSADAQRIAYDQAKDLITLEGDGRNDVQMEKIADNGSRTTGAARKVLYWRADNRLKIEDGSSAEFEAGEDPRKR